VSNVRRDEARAALDRARQEPREAIALATRVLAAATTSLEEAIAHFAIGLANRALFAGAASTSHLEEAASAAAAAGDAALLGQILRSLAFNYAQDGRYTAADQTIERSLAILDGSEREMSRLQQAFILMMRGDHRAALPVLNTAITAFEESGDVDSLGLTLYNRSIIFMEFGDYEAAIVDLERAYGIAAEFGSNVAAADAALHLSEVLGWKDDVPAAIGWHSRSVAHRTAAGAQNPQADTEHAFVLIQARLLPEAEEVLREALPRLVAAGGNDAVVTQAYLLLADVLNRRGAHDEAAAQVRLAAAATPPEGRFRFDVAAAEHQVRIASGETSPALLDAIVATAAEMELNGERITAAVERLAGVDVALARGGLDTAAELSGAAMQIARTGPLWLQIQAWTAEARVRDAAGNRRGAAAAVRAGMRRLGLYRRGIGAPDLRIRAAELGTELAAIGSRLAIHSAEPRRVYEWAERTRIAGAASWEPVPSVPPEIGTVLTRLRRTTSQIRRASGIELQGLVAAQRQLEREVRDFAHQATTSGPGRSAPPPLATLRDRLDGKTLVQYVANDGILHAVVITGPRIRLHRIGPHFDIQSSLDHLRLAAERIARASTSTASRSVALLTAVDIGESLRHRLIEPFTTAAGRSRLIVIPAGPLHAVPWNLVSPEPVEVAPSVTAWLQAVRHPGGATRRLVVTGPGLVHGTAEANAIAGITGATRTQTIGDTLQAMQGTDLVHFACHAHPRGDSPMFSSLVLDDGDLTIYDIQQSGVAPSLVVLAACDAGSAVLHRGEETLGLAAAFLATGTRTVVAPLSTVSDEATAQVMRDFHARVVAGADPATALAGVAQSPNDLVAFTARSFACFGASLPGSSLGGAPTA
jgi:tetratricopeptide (TPR) repeat protein